MRRAAFVVTIDTEGDNIWSRPQNVTTENARFLPRFQSLCEEYGFSPTYLVTYEMAMDPRFQTFGRAIVKRGTGEIGLHVHAWDSPPIEGSAPGARQPHVYLYELSDEAMYAKLSVLTGMLTDVFEGRPIAHRAGRWGFDERVARALADLGYLVDCSVTPGVSWRGHKGDLKGHGGPDFFGFPCRPYFLDLDDIRRSGTSDLLEVPVTIRSNYHSSSEAVHHAMERGIAGKVIRRLLGPPYTWLRPTRDNAEALLSLVDWAVQEELPVLEFMLHSSELMSGGSPTFQTDEHIETLYRNLRQLFARLASHNVTGMTLGGFRSVWG